MRFELRYGEGVPLPLEVPLEAVLADGSVPRGTPLGDPAAAVAGALAHPLDFPPLSQAIIPGDRVALAVEDGLPEVAGIVAGVVGSLLDSGAHAADISVLLAPGSDAEFCKRATAGLPPSLRHSLQVAVHDPRDSAALSYLAASQAGHPIYFHRRLCDADVVLPISTFRLKDSFGYAGVHGGLFPTFSDERTQQRFRTPAHAEWTADRKRRQAETDEAAWLLGIQCLVQVTPGPGRSALHVLAGSAPLIAKQGSILGEAAWLHRAPRRASLVVASIEGGPDQQTWENFARALFAASHAVVDGGAIVLCTHLCQAPGPALRHLARGNRTDEEIDRSLRRERSPDTHSATLLAHVQRRVRVYLLSGLDRDLVEDLGLGHVVSPEGVQRLSRQHGSLILLGNAQHAMFAASDT